MSSSFSLKWELKACVYVVIIRKVEGVNNKKELHIEK